MIVVPAISVEPNGHAPLGRFHAALRAGTAYEVPKNRVQFVPFQQSDRLAGIGLDDLCGGAVVAICSSAGAIVAHIPASPVPLVDVNKSMTNLRRRMAEVMKLAREHRQCFPPCSFTLIVAPTIDGKLAIPKWVWHIRNMMSIECFDPAITTYSMPIADYERGVVERGVVYVEGGLRRFSVYVEGRLIVGENLE